MTNRPDAGAPETALDRAYAMSVADVMSALATRADGLTGEEARERLALHGPNRLPERRRKHPAMRFLAQFNNVLIYFLLAASLAAFALNHVIDGAVIVAVVMINAVIGFVQEGKAEHALDAIRDMVAPHAFALRDGRRTELAVADLVPGDIVLLEAGDKVPADLRIIEARAALADEAVLTGESVPAQKSAEPVVDAAALGDRASMLYSGTLMATGQARALPLKRPPRIRPPITASWPPSGSGPPCSPRWP